MTRDDIIRMAREAWLTDYGAQQLREGWEVEVDAERLEAFAALIAAAEREACAVLCEAEWKEDGYGADVRDCAAAIRARGETK